MLAGGTPAIKEKIHFPGGQIQDFDVLIGGRPLFLEQTQPLDHLAGASNGTRDRAPLVPNSADR
jgi:hypothetical protein